MLIRCETCKTLRNVEEAKTCPVCFDVEQRGAPAYRKTGIVANNKNIYHQLYRQLYRKKINERNRAWMRRYRKGKKWSVEKNTYV